MVEIKNVHGSKESSQSIIETPTIIYVHSNVHKIEDNMYEYDEIQYTPEEWEDVKEVYYADQKQKEIAEQVTSLEAALCDIYELLISNN